MTTLNQTMVVEYRFAWWAKWYLVALGAFARLHGLQPDPEKAVRFLVSRAVTWRIQPDGKWRRL